LKLYGTRKLTFPLYFHFRLLQKNDYEEPPSQESIVPYCQLALQQVQVLKNIQKYLKRHHKDKIAPNPTAFD